METNGEWRWHARIPLNKPRDEVLLTLSTVQKNNKLKWIKDWIEYYKEVHGVDRVILYDNASEYQSTLEQELKIGRAHV